MSAMEPENYSYRESEYTMSMMSLLTASDRVGHMATNSANSGSSMLSAAHFAAPVSEMLVFKAFSLLFESLTLRLQVW